eukprot:CAMPEP_0184983970 /NCGR_PEP_ID=MMETSP1098-20130426/13039_1 /TAXON_ID=89044 /ORGANISM="Spumella elongata, Strain CCAP 955/1" /LENGTH=416 /DNA_ID=CAMNT_0027507875 /DNA_START=58 /DNA_END=1308 /DNA_ORIENTATION=-
MSFVRLFLTKTVPSLKGLKVPTTSRNRLTGQYATRSFSRYEVTSASRFAHALSVSAFDYSRNNSHSPLFLLLAGAALTLTVSTTSYCDKHEDIAWSRLEQVYKPAEEVSRVYVGRKETEAEIAKHIHSEPNRVMVLFGNRHIGKTTVLKQVLAQDVAPLAGRKGVIVVHLDTVKNIDQEVAKAFGVHPDTLRDSRAFIRQMCERFLAKHHYRPVIVFTTTGINKIVGNDALVLASMLREFSVETRAAVCVADLHDLDTAQSFPRDGRSLFVTVPELNKEEMVQYLGKEQISELAQRGVSVEQILNSVGGNPLTLSDLSMSDDPVVFLREAAQLASVELQETMEKSPAHSPAVLALSKAPFEAGLSLKAYSDAAESAQTTADIAKIYNNTVYYDFQNKVVKFRTRSLHAVAQKKSWF